MAPSISGCCDLDTGTSMKAGSRTPSCCTFSTTTPLGVTGLSRTRGCGSCRILGTPRWISTAPERRTSGWTSLAHVAHKYLGRLMEKGPQKSDWSRATLSKEQLRYALEDTSVLLELVEVLTSELHDLGMGQVAKLEARAFPAMVDMSLNGFPASRGTGTPTPTSVRC